MATPEPTIAVVRERLDALAARAHALESEGLPFPIDQIRETFDAALREGSTTRALAIVKRGEALLTRVGPDWTWVRELLKRADELRTIAQTVGVDVAHLDTRVGNPRRRLMSEPLSAGSLEKAAASASLALAVLNDAIPKFCLQEAQQLGGSIRRARNRGEEVLEATQAFSRLLQAVQDHHIPTAAQRLIELRRAVVRIPRAPAVPLVTPSEEEEILLEARNLARRLQRIKGKAQNAQSAARLMAQVRAAISEERRYGTPEEEIEVLWAEVDRLTREKRRASEGPPVAPEALAEPDEEEGPAPETLVEEDAREEVGHEPVAEVEDESVGEGVADSDRTGSAPPEEPSAPAEDDELPPSRTYRPSLFVPYVPPEGFVPERGADTDPTAKPRGRSRPRA